MAHRPDRALRPACPPPRATLSSPDPAQRAALPEPPPRSGSTLFDSPRPTESASCETKSPATRPARFDTFRHPAPNKLSAVRNESPWQPAQPGSTLFDNLRPTESTCCETNPPPAATTHFPLMPSRASAVPALAIWGEERFRPESSSFHPQGTGDEAGGEDQDKSSSRSSRWSLAIKRLSSPMIAAASSRLLFCS